MTGFADGLNPGVEFVNVFQSVLLDQEVFITVTIEVDYAWN